MSEYSNHHMRTNYFSGYADYIGILPFVYDATRCGIRLFRFIAWLQFSSVLAIGDSVNLRFRSFVGNSFS